MSQNKGLNPEAANGKANELSGYLGTIDHLIGQLAATHSAALHPHNYGIDPGEKTIAPWSVAAVSGARADLAAARTSAADLIARIGQEVGSQVTASSNGVSITSYYTPVSAPAPTQEELDEMIELLRLGANGLGYTPEERERLADFLAKYGKNESVMSELFQELGVEDTSFVLLSLSYLINLDPNAHEDDKQRNADLLLLAQQFRDALAVGSESWTPKEANAFLGENPFESQTTLAGLSFLFSDSTNPLGPALTVEMAERVDDWERVDNGNPTFAEMGLVPESGLYKLSQVEGNMLDGGSAQDLAGRVFETLGQYPDLALDFLAPVGDAAEGADRVAYWFGERDWSNLDQWEGPGALWLGAASSLDDAGPVAGYDGDVPNARNAMLTSEIILALGGNPSFESDEGGLLGANLSDDGAKYIAGAIALNLADINDGMQYSGFSPPSEGNVFVELGFGGEVLTALPELSPEALARIMAQIVGLDADGQSTGYQHEDAAQIIYNTATDLQTAYYIAGQGDHSLLGAAAARSMFLQALLDGTSMGGSAALAERHDQASDADIDSIMDVVKIIPFGGLASKAIQHIGGAIVGEAVTLNWLEKSLVSNGVSHGMSDLVDVWKNSQHVSGDVATLLADEKGTLATQANLRLANMLYGAVGDQAVDQAGNPIPEPPSIPTPRPKGPIIDPEVFAQEVDDYWKMYRTELGDAAGFDAEREGLLYQLTVDACAANSK